MADAAEMVEVAPMHSTGRSTGSINSLDAHRNDKARMELIVTLHGTPRRWTLGMTGGYTREPRA